MTLGVDAVKIKSPSQVYVDNYLQAENAYFEKLIKPLGGSTVRITKELLPLIEKALGFELYDNQKAYLLAPPALTEEQIKFIEDMLGECFPEYQKEFLLKGPAILGGRNSGRTTAYCIKLLLTDGPPLNVRKPHTFSDRKNDRAYSQHFFKNECLLIRHKLKKYGFGVRRLVNEYS